MNRRKFLSLSLAAAYRSAWASAPDRPLSNAKEATIVPGGHDLALVPADYTGLSYEAAQLYNPAFFSDANTSLVTAFRKLSPQGVLRIGGNLSDVTRWQGPNGDFSTPKQVAGVEYGKTYWEWKLTDPSVQANKDGAITPEAIESLGRFLRATGWKLIYGFNFGCGSPERAADEAMWVSREAGDRLLSFQVGNEADFFGGRPAFRQKPYDFEQYFREYREFVDAVRAKVPRAPFSGPDTATNMDWVDRFGQRSETPTTMLTSHFYAMGPASDPSMNAAFLLAHKNLDQKIEQVKQATRHSKGLGFRMTEGNSCYGGGKAGVSDAFASALWGADYMLTCAAAGYLGVNLHGGGDGIYTPIAAGAHLSTELRPLYFGMQFAQQYAGWQMRACSVMTDANLTAWLANRGSERQLALINKDADSVKVRLPWVPDSKRVSLCQRLTAPSLDAKQGVRLEGTQVPFEIGGVVVESESALLIRWR